MAASNTHECFREFLGQKLIGLLFSALPIGQADLNFGTKTLIFEDGRGLTLSSSGSYWIDSRDEVQRAIEIKKVQLSNVQAEIGEVLALAGQKPFTE